MLMMAHTRAAVVVSVRLPHEQRGQGASTVFFFFARLLSPTTVYPRIQHLQFTVVWYFGSGIYRTIVLLLYYCIHHHHHPSLYFLGASLLGHTPAAQYLVCTVGGSKEGRGNTWVAMLVHLHHGLLLVVSLFVARR